MYTELKVFVYLFFNIYIITSTTYRNIDINIDQLIIIYRYEMFLISVYGFKTIIYSMRSLIDKVEDKNFSNFI